MDSSPVHPFIKKNTTGTGDEGAIFLRLLPYVLSLILIPIFTFFLCKSYIFTELLGMTEMSSNIWSTVLSVILIHILVGLFVYKSMGPSEKTKKID